MPTITTGRYMKQDDTTEDGMVCEITGVVQENVAGEGKPLEMKWVLQLKGQKPLVLNKVNIGRLTTAFKTNNSDEWIGQSILVYVDPDVEFGGKVVGGLRLKAVKKTKATKPEPPTEDINADDIPF